MYIDILKQIVNNYEYYKSIAVNLESIEFSTKYYKWNGGNYKENVMTISLFTFPEGYLKTNFEQAYVQAVLSQMAHYQLWKKDFWKIPSSELMRYMTVFGDLFAEYINYRKLRMKSLMGQDLINIMSWNFFVFFVADDIEDIFREYIREADENIEIGSYCYGENTFVSIKDNTIMIIDGEIYSF